MRGVTVIEVCGTEHGLFQLSLLVPSFILIAPEEDTAPSSYMGNSYHALEIAITQCPQEKTISFMSD
jgi:hypothetical protein